MTNKEPVFPCSCFKDGATGDDILEILVDIASRSATVTETCQPAMIHVCGRLVGRALSALVTASAQQNYTRERTADVLSEMPEVIAKAINDEFNRTTKGWFFNISRIETEITAEGDISQ